MERRWWNVRDIGDRYYEPGPHNTALPLGRGFPAQLQQLRYRGSGRSWSLQLRNLRRARWRVSASSGSNTVAAVWLTAHLTLGSFRRGSAAYASNSKAPRKH